MRSSEATGRSGPSGRRGPVGPGDRGFVTAETAVVLPVLGLFALMLIWGLMAASGQMRCVDAARAGARAAARSEPQAAALAAARSAAPRGARVELRREGDLVRVRVEARAPGPGPLAVRLRGEAVALVEESVGRSETPPGGGGASAGVGEAGP
ncbi:MULTISPECIES: TadE family type IV pilus minor pilin [Streptomyces]|uniref:TadE family type IV pilus minor pilin n=1 Tax=Streptomyces lonegramiae TaxID=3075524 RepID=A0ABU2XM34_9ACTN|nr:TadE family type IV pilus minor pilin [Streptomyces sp. DSM 41529]MDT0546596.1 TadE family type IV pilus minor pilin [Streptomyces sp. DSM 41529]